MSFANIFFQRVNSTGFFPLTFSVETTLNWRKNSHHPSPRLRAVSHHHRFSLPPSISLYAHVSQTISEYVASLPQIFQHVFPKEKKTFSYTTIGPLSIQETQHCHCRIPKPDPRSTECFNDVLSSHVPSNPGPGQDHVFYLDAVSLLSSLVGDHSLVSRRLPRHRHVSCVQASFADWVFQVSLSGVSCTRFCLFSKNTTEVMCLSQVTTAGVLHAPLGTTSTVRKGETLEGGCSPKTMSGGISGDFYGLLGLAHRVDPHPASI